MRAKIRENRGSRIRDKVYNNIRRLLLEVRDVNAYKVFINKHPDLINPRNSKGTSLFKGILNEFGDLIKRKDRSYYIEVLALILEKDKDYESNAKVIEKFLENNNLQGDEYRGLLLLFGHYLNGNTIDNANQVSNKDLPLAKSNYQEDIILPDYMGIGNLVDLSNKASFTIDDSNLAYTFEVVKKSKQLDGTEKQEIIEINDETELKQLEKEKADIEIKVYVHVADLSEYLDETSDAYDYAKTKMFGKLFDDKFIENHVSFKDNTKRFAMTIEYTFDKYGKRKGARIYQSIIAVNNHANNKHNINKIKKLFEIEPDKSIKKEMSDEVNLTTRSLLENRHLPVIYKNIYQTNNMEKTLTNSDTSKLINELFKDYNTEREYMIKNCYQSNRYSSVQYDGVSDGKYTKIEITDPMHSFPALVNQMMIKKYALQNNDIKPEERMKDREFINVVIAIANAVNKKNGTRVEDLDQSRFTIKR